MTTTQTGGGNGAAPDGGSGRKLPTRAGAWWWQDNLGIGNPPRVIPVLEVADDEAPYLLAIMPALPTSLFVPVGETGGTWLAEVPPPSVCAALAEYGDAVLQRGPMQARGVSVSGALLALEDAIRAEHGGAA